MRATHALFGREHDVIARFQRLLCRLYAYRELLSFGECFIGHDVVGAHGVAMRAIRLQHVT